jgi:hypothetical protein
MHSPSILKTSVCTLLLAAAGGAAAETRNGSTQVQVSPPGDRLSDSERAMGTWALVVFNTKPFEFPNSGGADPIPLTVYTVGLRHWTRKPMGPFRNWGVDAGLGVIWKRSSVTSPQTGTIHTSSGPSANGVGLHLGLPLAVTHHQHATFELVPELDVIWARETIPALDDGDSTSYDGWSARLGARAGFEIYFGFVGLPNLAIEASLGAAMTYDSVRTKVGPIERSSRTWGFQTLRGDEPWSIFTGNVAAMYHF